MARLKDIVDECLLIASAFTSINSQTYNEIGAVNFEDNSKEFPLFLFNKRSVNIKVDSFTRGNLPSQCTYTCELHFMNTYTEAEKLTTDLNTKQDALIVIADQYLAELRTRCQSGDKGFYLGDVSFNSIDENHNEQLIELTYTVEFIAKIEACTTGSFAYVGLSKPTNLTAVSNSATTIDLAWTDNATTETAYEIYRSLDYQTFTLIDTIAANSTTYQDTVTSDVLYFYRVRAINASNNGEYSSIVGEIATSSVACVDSTYSITDRNEIVLYSGTIASGGALNQIITNSSVANSDASYNGTVLAQGNLILPNITIYKADGSSISYPSVKNVDVRDYQSGIAYQQIPFSGQTTSRNTYDEAWLFANGYLTRTPPIDPVYIAELDYTSLTPFYTLKNNNYFGNLNRFTDSVGGQTYANGLIIDHLYCIGIYNQALSDQTLSTQLSNAFNSTAVGLSGWFLASVGIANNLRDYELTSPNSNSLVSLITVTTQLVWTSTTRPGSTNGLYITNFGQNLQTSPTNTNSGILVRQHTF